MQYLIMCRSLTQAERAARLLEKNSVVAEIVKAPQGLHTRGCAYGLSLGDKPQEALSLLRRNNISVGKVFRKNSQGEYLEVQP